MIDLRVRSAGMKNLVECMCILFLVIYRSCYSVLYTREIYPARVYKATSSFTGRETAFIFLGHEVIGAVRNANLHR